MLAMNIGRVLGNCAMWTVTDLIGKDALWPSPQIVMNLAGKRLVISSECDIEEGMNYTNIKRWTSNA